MRAAVSTALRVVVTVTLLLFMAAGSAYRGFSRSVQIDGGTLASASRCGGSVTRHQITGWLHTCGGKLLDSRRHRINLTTLSVIGLGAGDGTQGVSLDGCPSWTPPSPYAYTDLHRWGFNSVRLNISWANLEPVPPTRNPDGSLVHHWNWAYVHVVDDAVRQFASHGTAVVLQMYQAHWSPAFTNLPMNRDKSITLCAGAGMPSWLYPLGGSDLTDMVKAEKSFYIGHVGQAGFTQAWKFIAARYHRNPMVVGADILNEPYDMLSASYPGVDTLTPKKMALADFYERVGRVIHKANKHLLLIFQDHKSKRSGLWALTRRPRLPQAVLADHFYAKDWNTQGRPRMVAILRVAQHWRYPLWIGEFTTYGRTLAGIDPSPYWRQYTAKYMAFCQKFHIGWAIWLYGAGNFQLGTDIRTPKPGLLSLISRYT